MKRLLTITLATLITACTSLTPSQQSALQTISAAAQPLVVAAAQAEGAKLGVPPTTTAAIVAAAGSLWGAYAVSLAGQPPATGASSPAVGAAIESAFQPGTTQAQKTVLLAQAASALLAPSK